MKGRKVMNTSSIAKSHWLSGQKKKGTVIRCLGLLLATLLWPLATAQGAVYSFNTENPNTSLNPNTGETIRLNGGGTFDTDHGAVLATGSYSIKDAEGQVIERGTWAATDYVSFEAQGGVNPGLQGGVLDITVTLFPKGGTPRTNVPMNFICPFESGVFDEGDDGTIVGDFTVLTGGITVLHLINP